MGLTREQVYLTQLLKFRPAQPRQTLNTRPPSDKELLISRPVVDFEMALVQPRVIVALGVIAARGLLQQGNLPLAAYQERVWDYNGIPVVVTHHPSYLLRTSDLGERRRLWEEMLRVMEMAGLPINDKQRGYFLPKA
jgi:DNA polymerase